MVNANSSNTKFRLEHSLTDIEAKSMFLVEAAILLLVYSRITLANPFVGLIDPACFVVRNESCPNKNVTFWLYTEENFDDPIKLDPIDINPWLFAPRRPVKILIHGYTGHRDFAPNIPIRSAFFENKQYYVISMDYGPLVRYPCYFAAVQNLPLASKCLAQLINNLVDQNIVPTEDIHLIGFSLGGQLAGQTANYVNKPLKRITGLDPAKPMFITASQRSKLDETDAEFVDVIHTDVLGRGMLQTMGHVDFYPNIGPYQPGCQEENVDDPGSCNHERASRFYAESINTESGFWGYSCPSWLHYTFGLCSPNEQQAIMGYGVNKSSRGSYFLTTAAEPPYALGVVPYSTPSNESLRLRSYYKYIDNIDDSTFEPQLRFAFIDDKVDSENLFN